MFRTHESVKRIPTLLAQLKLVNKFGNLNSIKLFPEIRPPREMLAMDVGSFPPSKKGQPKKKQMSD